VKVIVEGQQIYNIEEGKDTVITFQNNNTHLVVTDGYHISKPLELVYHHIHTYYFHVDCAISNIQLFYGGFLLLLSVILGLLTGSIFFQVMSFFPVLYLLYTYYVNRADFIQLHPM
jgi:hypothetical protein